MIGQTLGHYRVDKPLGAGGMGEVYSAHDTRLERDVALKVLPQTKSEDPAARKRFRQEALTLSRLNHPNIATIHDYDTADGVDFLVMELVRGATPAGPLSEKQVSAIGMQIAEGLSAAHAHGILHRDLKPANLAITPDGRIKILDFGLALLMRTTDSSPTVLHEQGTAGTLAYMAPEQINGTDIDERADIYATGAVLYELATGRRPFDAPVPGRLIHAILTEQPAAPSTLNPAISPQLDRIILKALEKDPSRRYQSANELLADLKHPSETAVTRTRKARWPVVAAAAVIASVLVAVLVINHNRIFGPQPRQAIAVLRFENASGNPEDALVTYATGWQIMTQLMKASALRVTNFPSTEYIARGTPIAEVGRRLLVDKVVDGSVKRNGDHLIVSTQLFDVATGNRVWQATYDRPATDLSLTSTVATAILEQLHTELTPLEKQQLTVQPVNERRVKAHELYLQGIYYRQLRPPQPAKSKEMFEKAMAIDPTYAPPYAQLAMNYASQGMFSQTIPPMQFYPKAKELALKALQLENNDALTLSQAHTVLGMTKLHHEWDWAGAEREFQQSIALNPSTALGHHWYAHLLLTLDRIGPSVTESERAAENDPLNVTYASCVGWHCLYARRIDQAVAQSLQAVEMDPTQFQAHYYLGRSYQQKGKMQEAIASFEQAVELSKAAPPAMSGLAYAYASAGRKHEAEEILTKLTKRSQERYIPAYDFAVVYAGLGDKEKVFEWLEKAYLERSSWLVHVKWDERFERYRSDPRFTHLLKRIGIPV